MSNANTTAVFVAADVDLDHEGEEALVYNVCLGDDAGEPIGTVYTVRRGRAAALALADKIARDRGGLEVVID